MRQNKNSSRYGLRAFFVSLFYWYFFHRSNWKHTAVIQKGITFLWRKSLVWPNDSRTSQETWKYGISVLLSSQHKDRNPGQTGYYISRYPLTSIPSITWGIVLYKAGRVVKLNRNLWPSWQSSCTLAEPTFHLCSPTFPPYRGVSDSFYSNLIRTVHFSGGLILQTLNLCVFQSLYLVGVLLCYLPTSSYTMGLKKDLG